jgi:Na+-driven multidrug efflux pump
MPASGFVFSSQSGCLLPMLIIFNLFFGKLIFGSTGLWLAAEGLLILWFIIKLYIFSRKIHRQFSSPGRNQGKIIDIKGETVQEK